MLASQIFVHVPFPSPSRAPRGRGQGEGFLALNSTHAHEFPRSTLLACRLADTLPPMTTTRKVAKYIAWTAGALLAIVICLYLILLAINWRDRPPSAAALELQRLLDERPSVAHDNNAYVYVLGFSAPQEMDPQAAGERRLEWLNSKGYVRDSKVPDPVTDVNYKEQRAKSFNDLATSCMAATRVCEDALEKNSAALSEWLSADAVLLERYRSLLQRSEWLEQVPRDNEMPLPMFSGVTDAQRLYLLSIWRLSDAGEDAAVRASLDADLKFWRRVLSSSDLLISKMIATAVIRQHFALGYLALKRLPPERLREALPLAWQTELTIEERSLLRPLSGEFAFASGVLREASSEPEQFISQEPTFLARAGSRIVFPLYKPQDTVNQIADQYVAIARAFDTSLVNYPTAKLAAESEEAAGVLTYIYNPIGDVLADLNRWALARYPARLGDIEGMRRAALLALQLRNRSVAPQQVAEELLRADLRHPYHQEPFEWDANEEAVVFVG